MCINIKNINKTILGISIYYELLNTHSNNKFVLEMDSTLKQHIKKQIHLNYSDLQYNKLNHYKFSFISIIILYINSELFK